MIQAICVTYVLYELLFVRIVQDKWGYCRRGTALKKVNLRKKEIREDMEAEMGQGSELDMSFSSSD